MGALGLWKDRGLPRSILRDFWDVIDDFDNQELSRKLDNYSESLFTPACDIRENDEAFILALDIPGVNKEEVNLEVDGNTLKVSGSRQGESSNKNDEIYRYERSFGKFERMFSLPENVDASSIEAEHNNGVLTIYLPKKEQRKARKIKIGTGNQSFLKKLTQKQETKSE
ncbi:MAG: Hsp20/alpha crystallin family protein [Bdellovibrionota bacterium]